MLARLGSSDPELLKPIRHRSGEGQGDLNLLSARDTLVRARTMLIKATRGLVKSGRTFAGSSVGLFCDPRGGGAAGAKRRGPTSPRPVIEKFSAAAYAT